MASRELIVLGTASQVPTRHRNHNGYLLRWDEHGLLFDPGEGTQRQMARANARVSAITHVCISHFHGDHCLGLAGIIQRISLDGVSHEVHAYYPGSGQVFYERLRHASIFHDAATIVPHPVAEPGCIARTDAWTLHAARLDHSVDTLGYRLEEHAGRTLLPDRLAARGLRGPAIGQLVREGEITIDGARVTLDEVSVPRPGQVFAFVMDTRRCDAAVELARGADLLVCESTYLSEDADKAHDHGHLTAREAATIAQEAGVRRLVLAHFSQRYPEIDPFLEEARPIHPDVVAAADLDVIEVPARRPAAG
ncbi:MAG: ribonuclease Z [Myxococcales bacterium]|nr:ribonuclease Z [Myxococcales bacterium]